MPQSLFSRLMERRAAIEAGDPTGAASGPNTAQVRAETAPRKRRAPARPRTSASTGDETADRIAARIRARRAAEGY